MKSLNLIEELNKILIDADKRCDIAFDNVGEQQKILGDMEHDLLNTYKTMKAKNKREFTDEFYNVLVERHIYKYEQKELEILKNLYNIPGLQNALNDSIYKLRKIKQEVDNPIYHYRSKKRQGEIMIVEK